MWSRVSELVDVQEEDRDIYGKITSDDRLETVCLSVPTVQETDNVGDPLWPTSDPERHLTVLVNSMQSTAQ
jgi:hypothetical protein